MGVQATHTPADGEGGTRCTGQYCGPMTWTVEKCLIGADYEIIAFKIPTTPHDIIRVVVVQRNALLSIKIAVY